MGFRFYGNFWSTKIAYCNFEQSIQPIEASLAQQGNIVENRVDMLTDPEIIKSINRESKEGIDFEDLRRELTI